MLTITCKRCGYENSIHEVKCRRCATTLDDSSNDTDVREFTDQYVATQGSTNKPFVVGLIGSTIMFIGVFTPIFSLPFLGNMNYFQNGSGDGVVVLAFSLVSVVLILGGRYRGLVVTGGLSLAMLIFTFVSFQYRISQARSALQNQGGGGLFGGLGETLIGSVQLQWGWAILIIGSIVVIAAGLMKQESAVSRSSGVMRSISDLLEDTKVLAGIISLIVVVAAGLIALNIASNSQTIQKATNTVKETVFPDASVTAMQKALRVEFVGKEHVKADGL
ncbi:MAG: hypothetical protein PSX80_16515 [bacterium]|nr:hypothetical protein [bacterium]